MFYNFYLQFFVFVDDDDLLLLLLLVATVIVLGLIMMSYCLAYQNLNADKMAAYECGFQPFEDMSQRFDIKYYMIGILFMIFDLEIMFMLPWTQCFEVVGVFGTMWLVFFLFILTLAFVYEWVKGVLQWS